MDAYKPLCSKKKLKELCDQKRQVWDTPLEQGRQVIHTIDRLRRQKLYKYEPGEWESEPDNQVYVKIAKEYNRKRAERIKACKEARPRLND